MASNVNLDALIPRDDFDASADYKPVSTRIDRIGVRDLTDPGFFYSSLKKPDFQRETSEWDARKIAEFVKTFIDGDLVPAVILWQSSGSNVFVIDGGHRLSSLIAWINDDYGDTRISKKFYKAGIPPEQLKVAQRARDQVEKAVGPFRQYADTDALPGPIDPLIVERARRLSTAAVMVQWVDGGPSSAETSFLKINQQGTPIDKTELRVLAARRTPLGIAARAIVRSGEGHKYWGSFTPEVQRQLEALAGEVHALLFQPSWAGGPVKTQELPIGGESYGSQSLSLVLEFISLVNKGDLSQPDPTGTQTLAALRRCKRVAEAIDSHDPSSLGLHPMIYFYADSGRHKLASFWAVTVFVQDLISSDRLPTFTRVRSQFEELLRQYDYLVQQIVRIRRSAAASVALVNDFYMECVTKLDEGKSIAATVDAIVSTEKFKALSLISNDAAEVGKDFSTAVKSKVFIRSALDGAMRCAICGGYLHGNALSIDHKERKQDGGMGDFQNAQLAHPYCNSGFKEGRLSPKTGA